MNRFLIKVAVFLLSNSLILFLLVHNINGYSDTIYLRFTSPRQTSLILGTSRAAQGLQPSILNRNFPEKQFYNFSFTLAHSRYGPNYLRIIQKKLKEGTHNGVFILTVDPWSISSSLDEGNDSTRFQELGLETSIHVVDLNPNVFYLLKKYQGTLAHLIFRKNSTSFLHNDGWLEVSPTLSILKKRAWKIRYYREQNLPGYKYSSVRFSSLFKTIRFLQSHGKVFLVRLPVHPLMMDIENEFMPSFSKKIDSLSNLTRVHYYDMTPMNAKFLYTDGNHIHKASTGYVTQNLSDWIRKSELQDLSN
jgi:hypothetical protein